MGERTSCIEHPESTPIVIIRADYLAICEDDHCRAALLAIFEWWTNVKRGWSEQARMSNDIARAGGAQGTQDEDTWIWKTVADLSIDMLGLYSERSIRPALKWLAGQGFIQSRRNPQFGWDATPQYKLNVENVNAALRRLPRGAVSARQKEHAASGKNGHLDLTKNGHLDLPENAGAIPESTAQSISEELSSSATTRARAGEPEPPTEPPERPAVYAAWEHVGGPLTARIADFLHDAVADYGEAFVMAAIKEAGDSSSAVNVKYVRSILESCRREGRFPGEPRSRSAGRPALEKPDEPTLYQKVSAKELEAMRRQKERLS